MTDKRYDPGMACCLEAPIERTGIGKFLLCHRDDASAVFSCVQGSIVTGLGINHDNFDRTIEDLRLDVSQQTPNMRTVITRPNKYGDIWITRGMSGYLARPRGQPPLEAPAHQRNPGDIFSVNQKWAMRHTHKHSK